MHIWHEKLYFYHDNFTYDAQWHNVSLVFFKNGNTSYFNVYYVYSYMFIEDTLLRSLLFLLAAHAFC